MSRRTTLKGLYFVWYITPSKVCHGQILGRITDVTEADAYLLKLFPLRGDATMLAADLDTILDGQSIELYEDEAVCRAAFERVTEAQHQGLN